MDLKFVRENPEKVKEILRRREEQVDIDKILALDEKRRILIKKRDELRHLRKEISEFFNKQKEKLSKEEINKKREEAKEISRKVKEIDDELSLIEKELKELLLYLPNKIHPSVKDEEVIIKEEGEIPKFDFKPFCHWEIGEVLGILDLERSAKIAGSRFILFKGLGALLERALINFCLDYHRKYHNYLEISPPYLNKEECFYGAGQLPKLKDEMYYLPEDELYLIPTAEVPLVNLHANEILKEDDLPKYYMAYTACFRREAGSYGKDVRGIIRVHQFDKVELVKYTLPEDSYFELEKMVKEVEAILKALKLPYRIKQLAAKDMAFQSAKTYDIDVYAVGIGEWLEVSSISNCEDFQAKRNNTRVRRRNGELDYCHILNGSGVAFPRVFIAIVENYQQKDGSIIIPEVLRPYLSGLEKIERRK
jgi:seryl-tRNA synthetase